MSDINLKLTASEINATVPTAKTGVFPLAVKIKEQAEAQMPQGEQR